MNNFSDWYKKKIFLYFSKKMPEENAFYEILIRKYVEFHVAILAQFQFAPDNSFKNGLYSLISSYEKMLLAFI